MSTDFLKTAGKFSRLVQREGCLLACAAVCGFSLNRNGPGNALSVNGTPKERQGRNTEQSPLFLCWKSPSTMEDKAFHVSTLWFLAVLTDTVGPRISRMQILPQNHADCHSSSYSFFTARLKKFISASWSPKPFSITEWMCIWYIVQHRMSWSGITH